MNVEVKEFIRAMDEFVDALISVDCLHLVLNRNGWATRELVARA